MLEQDFKTLESLAKDANTFSNLVSRLSNEYNDYLRQNSRYEFVTKEVKSAPAIKEYVALDSKFKGIRNQAYLNLGKLSLADGKQMQAFLFLGCITTITLFVLPRERQLYEISSGARTKKDVGRVI